MVLCSTHDNKGYTEDPIQTRIRDTVTLTAGAGSVVIAPPPNGQFWLIDRVNIQCDAGASAVLTLYDGSADPTNAISGGVAQAGLGLIVGSFNPPIEIGQEGLTVGVTGVVGLTQVAVNVWYRRRYKIPTTPRVDKYMPVQANPSDAESLPTVPAQADTMPLPAIPMVDDREREPGIGDVPVYDGTYR